MQKNSTARKIELLKNTLASREDSPFWFFNNYIKPKTGHLTYKDFLRKINWYEETTYKISGAIDKYVHQPKEIT